MSTTLFSSMRNELEKLALTRWQQEMAAGNLGPQEMSRLPATAGLSGGANLRAAREGMWQAGHELNPNQLARHRRLNQYIGKSQLKAMGGGSGFSYASPNVTAEGNVRVADNAGSFLHAGAESPKKLERFQRGEETLSELPVDKSMYRGAVAHEGGEKELLTGLQKGVPANAVSGHLGALPVVQEQLATYRDPKASSIFSRLRRNPDDQFITKKIRQFGGTPNNPLPVGGKAHVALEKAVGNYKPVMPGGIQLRQQLRNIHGVPAVAPHNMGAILKTLPSLVRK